MLGYIYDKDTKEFLKSVIIQENPKHAGEYLMPDNCTLIEPKNFSTGTATCFINGNWIEITDHRKHYQVNLETLEFTIVDYLGDAQEGYQFITDEVYADYQTDNEKYKVIDGVFTDISDTEEYQEILRRRERERIAKLHLTRGDVFRALLLDSGVTREQIRQKIEALPEETQKQQTAKELARIDFDEALEFYRGNTLINLIGEQLGYTPQQLDTLFKTGGF